MARAVSRSALADVPLLPASSVVPAPPALEAARRAVATCRDCPRLVAYREGVAETKRAAFREETYWGRPVPGFGDPAARLLIVGLAPAAHGANRTGRMFTGDGDNGSGDFLMRALHGEGFATLPTSRRPDDGLVLRDVYIVAVARCAPPDNKPTPEEIGRCRRHLEAETAALPGIRAVVALGKLAFDGYLTSRRAHGVVAIGLEKAGRPRFAHGASLRLSDGTTLFASYHPSRQNTHTGRLTAPMLAAVFRAARTSLAA